MPANPIEPFANDESLLLRIVFLVILAPLIEEFIFRKTLIDRMRPYGEKLAVVTTALMFGLFHGNLSQMFYAFTLGLVFGYVYLRTGKLRYTVGLHMLINLLGGVVGPALTEWAGPSVEALEEFDPADMSRWSRVSDLSETITPGAMLLSLYTVAMLAAGVAGLVVLIVRARRVYFRPAPLELGRGQRFRTVWLSPGMLAFVVICLAMVVTTFLA
jgi:membrane protease YdiL (CAAX protease family)